MDPCAGLHILAHGSIPLPYLPNLCAVLRPAPLASYYFPFLSFPLLSPCIGLSLDRRNVMYLQTLGSSSEVHISRYTTCIVCLKDNCLRRVGSTTLNTPTQIYPLPKFYTCLKEYAYTSLRVLYSHA